ncbi:sigma-70 family RNA polymerase sigma factor [Rubripirellula lacrimiformis]|uniref:sigma-70 family RNA polymerase sigma factor n=1 Tax=Rubripirellula lacrimiformis TaxID=1930273 RepID=UPI001C54D3C8|nr:sigma-70 family RNA polymerase sigma factor [Rubripirellula lacrimiformis]
MTSISTSPTDASLIKRCRAGDRTAFSGWFDSRRGDLKAQVHQRLYGRMLRRVDASDVVQELFLDADQRLPELQQSELPLDGWLRILLKQKLVDLQRRHIHAAKRSVRRERPMDCPGSNGEHPKDGLAADVSSPSMHLQRIESRDQVQRVLANMAEVDREVLVLRHFQNLSNAEVAAALCISSNAASNRYVRALMHFRQQLAVTSTVG